MMAPPSGASWEAPAPDAPNRKDANGLAVAARLGPANVSWVADGRRDRSHILRVDLELVEVGPPFTNVHADASHDLARLPVIQTEQRRPTQGVWNAGEPPLFTNAQMQVPLLSDLRFWQDVAHVLCVDT
eukprot:Opistho-2@70185